ncbi:MAG: 5-deoxy-glucuronate isomerase [Clostridiales bacterium]|nr:5-deoxy-glucuronate isomerase [Clostridiales bacterium]
MFGYPEFDKNGEKILSKIDGINKNMLMDISVYKLKKGQSKTFYQAHKEIAILLVLGDIKFCAKSICEKAKRDSLFDDLPTCLHVCKDTLITIEANLDSEIIYQATDNDANFDEKLYRKEDIIRTVACEGMWENTAVRDVNTIFDKDNAPYSNMVIGEVLARQGRWWSYVPHSHPQPEVYYYKFERPEGFGACFIGDKAYTIKDGSYGCFEGGKTHAQVTAPGYPMYNVWMIRHLDGNPWLKTRNVDTRYAHLESECKFVPKES